MHAKRQTATFVIAGLTSALLFGAATPASKALLDGIQAQALAGLLYLGAALGVLPVIIRERTFQWPWRDFRTAAAPAWIESRQFRVCFSVAQS